MGERKTLLVSKGTGTAVPMTVAQYRALVNSLPPQQRRLLTVRGSVDGFAQDSSGRASVEKMTHEQVSARVDRGQDPVLVADDPRRDVARASEQKNLEYDVADDATAAMLYRTLPILGQKLQNMAVGDEEATEYRQKLLQANAGAALGIDAAMMAVGGLGMMKLAPTLLSTTKGVKGFGSLMGVGAAQDTYMYAQYLADNNLPFRSEDYARELMVGALINLPLSAGAAVRGAVVKGAGAVLEGGGDLAGTVATAYNLKTVMAAPHSMQAAVAARSAGAFRILSKFGRTLRGKSARPMTVFDPLEDAEKFAKYQNKRIANLTPEKLARMSEADRAALIGEVSGWADVAKPGLDQAEFSRIPDRLRAVDESAKKLAVEVDNINVKMGDWVLGIGGKGSKKQAAAFMAHMDSVLGKLDEAGWGDIGGWLKETVELNPDGTLKNPHMRSFGKVVKARLDARLKRLITGGAATADDELRGLINNSDAWGKGKHPKRAVALNEAIDELAEAQHNLQRLYQKKHLNDFGPGDARQAQALNAELDKLRTAYRKMEDAKVLSRKQVEVIEKKIKQAQDAATQALPAYQDAARVNDLRGKAAGNVSERIQRVQQGAVDFRAQQVASAAEEAKRFMGFSSHATMVISKGLDVAARVPVSGVILIRNMSRQEKDLVFSHLSEELPKLTGSPEYMEEQFAGALGATQDADPDVSTLGAIGATQTLHYLSLSLPKPNYSLMGGLEPGRLQKEAFLNKYAAIMDPLSVAYAALEGRATADMIQAIRVTQQAAYTELSNMLAEALEHVTPKTPRKTINGIQAFLGGLDPLYRGETIMQLQSNYAQNQQQDQAVNGPAGKFRDTSNPQSSDNAFTFTQRLQSY